MPISLNLSLTHSPITSLNPKYTLLHHKRPNPFSYFRPKKTKGINHDMLPMELTNSLNQLKISNSSIDNETLFPSFPTFVLSLSLNLNPSYSQRKLSLSPVGVLSMWNTKLAIKTLSTILTLHHWSIKTSIYLELNQRKFFIFLQSPRRQARLAPPMSNENSILELWGVGQALGSSVSKSVTTFS